MKPQVTEGTDITARLTTWCHAPQSDSAQDLMDEAAKEIERLRDLVRFQDGVIRSGDVACLASDEREAVDIACMNLAETARRGQKKQDEYMQEGDLEGAKWTEKGVVSLVQARATLRSLLERNGAVSGSETAHLSERDRDLLRFAANTIGDADCAALFRRLLKDLP